MISVQPRPRRQRRQRVRSLADEQESINAVIRKNSTEKPADLSGLASANQEPNNNKDLDANERLNISNTQRNNNQESTGYRANQESPRYQSTFTFQSNTEDSPREPVESRYSRRRESNDRLLGDNREENNSSTTSSRPPYSYSRGYHSEGPGLTGLSGLSNRSPSSSFNSSRIYNNKDETADEGYSSYKGRHKKSTDDGKESNITIGSYFSRHRHGNTEEDQSKSSSQTSSGLGSHGNEDNTSSSDIKYRYTNGSAVMPSDESYSRRKYTVNDDSTKSHSRLRSGSGGSEGPLYSNSGTRYDAGNCHNSMEERQSSDSSVSSSGTLTITMSSTVTPTPIGGELSRLSPQGEDNNSMVNNNNQGVAPLSDNSDIHGGSPSSDNTLNVPPTSIHQTRLEGDNISLASTMSSLSTSSMATTDSHLSDAAKRQSVSSLSDLEHLGKSVILYRGLGWRNESGKSEK